MANRSKQKGDRCERAAVNFLVENGISAKRVPLSGAAQGFTGDIHFECQGIWTQMECKSRKKGFKEIRDWLDGESPYLWLKQDNLKPMVVMDAETFAILASYK